MIDALDLTKHNRIDIVRAILNDTVIHDYGIVHDVFDKENVSVLSYQALNGSATLYPCKYLCTRSKLFSMKIAPKKGDPVLIASLQNKSDKMFYSDKPLDIVNRTGYGPGSLVAIPIGVFSESSDTIVVFTDDGVTVKSVKSLSVEAESVSVEAAEGLDLHGKSVTMNGDTVEINGGGKQAARKGDPVKISLGPTDIQALATALLGTGAFTPTGNPPAPGAPVTINGGEITAGSGTVEIGD